MPHGPMSSSGSREANRKNSSLYRLRFGAVEGTMEVLRMRRERGGTESLFIRLCGARISPRPSTSSGGNSG